MNCGDYTYIWHAPDWPNWRNELAAPASSVAQVGQRQGHCLAACDTGLSLRDEVSLATLTDDVLKTSEIEGERRNSPWYVHPLRFRKRI